MYKRAITLLLFLMTIFATVSAQSATVGKTTLIRAGRLLNVKAGVYRDDQGVLVGNERVKEVGAFKEQQARAPKDALVLDLSQMALLPGLIDCHSHLLDAMERPVGCRRGDYSHPHAARPGQPGVARRRDGLRNFRSWHYNRA
jgi:imidazolonepropionase-like amidohydrolase